MLSTQDVGAPASGLQSSTAVDHALTILFQGARNLTSTPAAFSWAATLASTAASASRLASEFTAESLPVGSTAAPTAFTVGVVAEATPTPPGTYRGFAGGDATTISAGIAGVAQGPRLDVLSLLSHDPTSGLFNNTTTIWPADAQVNGTAGGAVVPNVATIVIISFVVTLLAVLTAGGNIMVMVSFKMDKQLQTVSNYFLLSLAVADLCIGLFSMPLYTVYLLMDRWPLGPIICDVWLSIDYTMSNASVANLLLISFDRYLSVTRPLTYRAKRTPKRAAIMISLAWVISALLWTPWVFAWPYIEGDRSVPENECYIQFLETNQYITVVTAVAAFYLPVLVMCVLYFKIFLETEKRNRGLAKLQATKQISKYGDSSDDDVCTSLSQKRSDSSPELEDVEDFHNHLSERHRKKRTCMQKMCGCCRIDHETVDYADDSSSSDPPGSPVYECTPSASQHVIAIRRDQSLHEKMQNGRHSNRRNSASGLMIPLIAVDSNRSTPSATPSTDMTGTMSRHSQLSSSTAMTVQSGDSDSAPPQGAHSNPHLQRASSQDRTKKDRSDMYTILIKLPDENSGDPNAKPTIKMITDSETDEEDPRLERGDAETIPMTERRRQSNSHDTPRQDGHVIPVTPTSSLGRRLSQSADIRMAMQARVAAKMVNKAKSLRARKKRQERKQDKKAAKTLSAILLAFIITWTPYNIFIVIRTFCPVHCINDTIYAIGKSNVFPSSRLQ